MCSYTSGGHPCWNCGYETPRIEVTPSIRGILETQDMVRERIQVLGSYSYHDEVLEPMLYKEESEVSDDFRTT